MYLKNASKTCFFIFVNLKTLPKRIFSFLKTENASKRLFPYSKLEIQFKKELFHFVNMKKTLQKRVFAFFQFESALKGQFSCFKIKKRFRNVFFPCCKLRNVSKTYFSFVNLKNVSTVYVFSFSKYEKEKLTLLKHNLAQQTEQK